MQTQGRTRGTAMAVVGRSIRDGDCEFDAREILATVRKVTKVADKRRRRRRIR